MPYQPLFIWCDAVIPKMAKLKTLQVWPKTISASNFFMHIFHISVTYLHSVENIQWKL